MRRLERLFDEQRDFVEIEGLVRVVIRPLFHRFDGRVDVRIGGQHDDQRVGRPLLDLLQHRQTVTVGEPVVEQHQVHAVRALGERVGGGCRLDDVVAFGS